jgi:ribosome-binding ATPase
MGIYAGLVGLPNVGKSTLFNALTKSNIPAENYPFCTIDPHKAITEVPDIRVEKLQKIFGSEKTIPATVTFIDIAGLVKGAASGEGLGNQFLGNIREVDLILHILRAFEDPNVTHTAADINPVEDYEIIVSELMLKDLEAVEKRIEKAKKLLKPAANKPAELKELNLELENLDKIKLALDKEDLQTVKDISKQITTLFLLSAKEYLIIANLAEHEIGEYNKQPLFQAVAAKFPASKVIPISAKIENELAQLTHAEAEEMMTMLDLTELGLDKIIQKTYENLGLITFFTCGPKEIHSWPIKKGLTVREAAGEIHSDLQKGFICAEVYNCQDLFEVGNVAKLKETGKFRTEGQDYIVQDGDIINVRFNV